MNDAIATRQPPAHGAEWYRDVPRSISRLVLAAALLLSVSFGGFSVWAFGAPLAAAVIAQGSFVATGRNRIVQHLEGGIIDAILVSEGDYVTEGQVLVRLDDTAAEANNRELMLRRIRLEATEARLLAEHARDGQLVFPEHLDALRDDPDVAAILDGQRVAFSVTRSGLMNDLAIVQRNMEALQFREAGYSSQRQALRDQIDILREELVSQEELLERGLIRRSEVLALRRALLEGEGQVARLDAELGEIAELQSRAISQRERTLDEYGRNSLDQLQVVQSELESVREQARRSENVLLRTEVTAPDSGTIVRLYYHTTGGVIETGRAIAEIVPSDAPLIIEALVARADIDSIEVGQPAVVRLTGLNQRTTPVLNGRVDYVSADAVADSPDGSNREVYVVRVALSPEELARVRGFAPTPGMPAEVMVQTAERTFAQYIAKPIVDSMSRAFREQ
ncbi:HlyD family type I secretion periplasmic adaptor subunit [Roseibacterium sp. SDUM158017]|uniref:HlyD family type I secretion periplasmic adaptor subunit n=1 Tax=Roseicyclus salinarum TaxID=3036773 RepID=UPI002415736A|nr:HlyD family type I secretion periplasmic adaptor subunit [Roseibacterium sp. SDUM158017]MDG4650315.1 HlyD family type I secretion periplasmic adaptor subunit [Roseibacterium sp. SDUM158017]